MESGPDAALYAAVSAVVIALIGAVVTLVTTFLKPKRPTEDNAASEDVVVLVRALAEGAAREEEWKRRALTCEARESASGGRTPNQRQASP